jgi:hypothetical protein
MGRPGAEAADDGRNTAAGGAVQEILDRLCAAAQSDPVTLGDVVAAFGRRSFLPVLMVPALLVVSPLSGVPFFSSVCGLSIALVSAQMLWPGQECLWLPGKLTRRRLSGPRARAAIAQLAGLARWLDRHARPRWRVLLRRPGRHVVEAACLACGLAMPFLEVVPFSSSILGFAVLLMATGLLARDGLFALLGLAVTLSGPLAALAAFDAVFRPG